jgi:phage tail sheath protein FI
LAPGVYVEEIPSAQQPIAGVGTNTVGFIGLVEEDAIYYPEPNPDYDPVVAQAAFRLAQLRDEEAKLRADASQASTPADRARIAAQIAANEAEKLQQLQALNLELQELQRRIAELPDIITGLETARTNALTADTEARNALEQFDQQFQPEPNEEPQALGRRRRTARRPFEQTQNATTAELERVSGELSEAQTELTTKEGMAQELREKIEQTTSSTPAATTSSTTEQPPPEAVLLQESPLKPYVLRKFDINVDPGETKLCTNFTEYTNRFGPFSADYPDFVPARLQQGKALSPGHRALTHAVNGFFKNGGTRCFVTRVKDPSEIGRALEAFESIDEVAIIAAPGFSDPNVWDQVLTHCERTEDRFAILDSAKDVETLGELDLTLLNYSNPSSQDFLPQRNRNGAFYFPHIEVVDPAKQLQDEDLTRRVDPRYRGRVYVPPSGHIAGIYARTDETRGVHKAPANSAILGALNVRYYISKPKQELLNPQGVNCIRNLNGNITVWGARTIGGDKNGEWKYVNVRRFFLFLRESIDEGTQWIVFEPNDQALWGKIRRNLTAFLTNVWRSGALFGATPEEAFYVKCDAETNPPEVRDLGMVVTEIGVAIVRPAEFVIFRVTQSTGPRTS